ncbi:MAG TPA: mannose-6-phosphate isomerase, partial [Rhodobacter sp.]|nr:mannose-6-phosphate isomerase [Rhodobacter sp.]
MCSERHLNQGSNFLARPLHRLWLVNRAHDLLSFFLPASINSAGGFYALDQKGAPIAAQEIFGELRSLHATTRMVHCAVIGHQLGLPGADYAIDHGLDFLWSNHRDARAGGYFWTVNDLGAVDGAKMAYGHAFVLLAAASAKVVGHPDADRLLTDISQILQDRFWDAKNGAATEEYNQDWSVFSNYRGQNSNMHLTESLMAAYEATGDATYLTKATSIAELIINRHARSQGWRVAEHFDPQWNIDRDYK